MSPFDHHKRRRRSALEMAQIFADRGGRCHVCERPLGPADSWELDHVVALALGGTDDDDNLAPCCSWCHDPKSDDDTSRAAKGKRAFTRHVVPAEHRRSRSCRRW